MNFSTGQNICLWQVSVNLGNLPRILVLREVIVKVTELKTGALGEFSNRPSPFQSVLAVGDDGKEYQKHWNIWPESELCDFANQWTERSDGAEHEHHWRPVQAADLYNEVASNRVAKESRLNLVNRLGEQVYPKGDASYCEEHDWYSHAGNGCEWCEIDNHVKRRRAMGALPRK